MQFGSAQDHLCAGKSLDVRPSASPDDDECLVAPGGGHGDADRFGLGDQAAVGEDRLGQAAWASREVRSEEHTSELQSHSDLVCRLLLEKKKHERSQVCYPPAFLGVYPQ